VSYLTITDRIEETLNVHSRTLTDSGLQRWWHDFKRAMSKLIAVNSMPKSAMGMAVAIVAKHVGRGAAVRGLELAKFFNVYYDSFARSWSRPLYAASFSHPQQILSPIYIRGVSHTVVFLPIILNIIGYA